jgi:hypothetical protein
VLVYVPVGVFAGTATCTVGVTVKLPSPLLTAALKSFTAVGAVAPAGTVRGYVIELVGFVQVVPPAQLALTEVTCDADVDSELPPPVENVVDVMVTFQPAPDPLASDTVIGIVYVGVLSVPSRVTAMLGAALVDNDRVPALTVKVDVTFAADTELAVTSAITAARTATESAVACFVIPWSLLTRLAREVFSSHAGRMSPGRERRSTNSFDPERATPLPHDG